MWAICAHTATKNTPAPDYSLFQSFILNENDGGSSKKNTEQNKTIQKRNRPTRRDRGKQQKAWNCTLLAQQMRLFLYFNVCCPMFPMECKEHFQSVRVCVFCFHSLLPLACHQFVFSFSYFMSAFMTLMECRTSNGMQIFSFSNSL